MFFGQEFIEGAARLRGTAKALDVWRMETKVEVLFEEVLNLGFARISLVFPFVFFHEKRGINWENIHFLGRTCEANPSFGLDGLPVGIDNDMTAFGFHLCFQVIEHGELNKVKFCVCVCEVGNYPDGLV